MPTTRIYLVSRAAGTAPNDAGTIEGRLVRASSQSMAIRHVVRNTYKAEVATPDQLVDLVTIGTKVEEAGEEE